MTMEAGVRAVVVADSAVASLIDGRMYPSVLPQSPTYPAVTYQRISSQFLPTLDGQMSRVRARVQVDIYARDPDAAGTVAAAIVAALEGYRGTSAGTLIHDAKREDEQAAIDGDERLYRVILDWFVTYSE